MNDRFLTSQACLTALASGSARYYQPTFFKPKSLARGERVLPLEHDACVRMQIVGSIAWVPQARGTEFVFRGTTPIRRRDCGNAVYGIVYPPTPVARLTPTRKDTVYIDSTIVVRRDLVEERIVEEQAPPLVVKSGFPWWRTLGAAALVSAGACAVASDRFGDKWYKFNCFPGDRVEVDVTQVVQALRAFRRQ